MTVEESTVRAPSIRDVARAAGVSHQTVSRVLNNSVSIRDETRDRVLAAIAELRYRPNRAARALGSSRSGTIGVLASIRSEYGPARSVQAIEDEARRRGFAVATATVRSTDEDALRDALQHLVDQDVEGLVVLSPRQRVFDAIAELAPRVPTVTMRGAAGGDEADAVSVDDVAGARAATAHLADLGHRHLRHLAGPQDWIEADARMRGFLLELSDRDLPTLPPVLGDWTADFGYRAGLELLPRREATAYFCASDAMALGLVHAARDLGLEVPGDLSVVGYDDVPEAAHFLPPLTTVRADFAEAGRRCLAALLGPVVGADGAPPSPPMLVVRGSSAAPDGGDTRGRPS